MCNLQPKISQFSINILIDKVNYEKWGKKQTAEIIVDIVITATSFLSSYGMNLMIVLNLHRNCIHFLMIKWDNLN